MRTLRIRFSAALIDASDLASDLGAPRLSDALMRAACAVQTRPVAWLTPAERAAVFERRAAERTDSNRRNMP